jgi:predicted Zn-dependent protease
MKNTSKKGLFWTALMMALLLGNGTVWGQSFEKEYERALLDSLVRFERLKRANVYLDNAFQNKSREAEYWKLALSESEKDKIAMKEENEILEKKLKRRGRIFKAAIVAMILLTHYK